ncbi:MAG: hypothetical protein P4L46_26235 [Fimbriimonas sp.]|nr:hypothetical protein [Fimbriimonas sp.]
MNKTLGFLLVAGLLAIPLVGCHKDDVEVIEPEAAPKVFDGVPDAKYAGTWKTENGQSTYWLAADGTYKLQTKIQVSHQKPFLSHLTGRWGAKNDKMEFRDESGNVSTFGFEVQGEKMTLTSLGSLKSKTVMDRVAGGG